MTRTALPWLAALALAACNDGGAGDGTGGTGTGADSTGAGTAETNVSASAAQSDGSSSGGNVDCTVPTYADDIRLQDSDAVGLPETPHRLVPFGEGLIACGDGFFGLIESTGAAPRVLEDPVLAGTCTGLSRAGDAHALVTTDAGQLVLVEVGAGAPTISSTVPDVAARVFDVVGTATDAWVAAGTTGVVHFEIDGGVLGAAEPIPGASDARGLALVEGALLVADGYALGNIDDPTVGGAIVRLLDTGGGGSIADVTPGPGIATRPYVVGGRAIVLRPGHGFDVFDVSPSTLELSYSTPVGQVIVDAAFDGDDMLAAAGSRLLRFTVGETESISVSSEDRPDRGSVTGPWFRAVGRASGAFVVGLGDTMVPVELGAGEATPQISFEAHTLTMAVGQTEALFSFDNLGRAPLIVTGVEADAPFSAEIAGDLQPERPGCPGQFELDPGGRLLFYARTGEVADHTERSLRLFSNDPDQSEFEGIVEINRPPPMAGDAGEDFHLLSVDGTDIEFSSYAGKVVLAKLYNPL